MALHMITVDNCDGIIKKYSNMLFKLSFVQTHKKEHAEDILQNTFLKLIQSKNTFESEEKLKVWLIKESINASEKIYSFSKHKKRGSLQLEEDVLFKDEEKSEVYYAILELPKKYRSIVHLYYYENISKENISKVFDIKVAAVEARINKAKKLLEKRLKGVYNYE